MGTTITLLRYNLKKNNFALTDSTTIAKGANPGIRSISFSIDKNHLILNNKNLQIRVYDMSSDQKYLNLANEIIKEFSKP